MQLNGLTGATTDSLAWDALFRYYNQSHGHGNPWLYARAEESPSRWNITTGYPGNVDTAPIRKLPGWNLWIFHLNWSNSMLKQLSKCLWVWHRKISHWAILTDSFFDHYWDMCHSFFPGWNILTVLQTRKKPVRFLLPAPSCFTATEQSQIHFPRHILMPHTYQ